MRDPRVRIYIFAAALAACVFLPAAAEETDINGHRYTIECERVFRPDAGSPMPAPYVTSVFKPNKGEKSSILLLELHNYLESAFTSESSASVSINEARTEAEVVLEIVQTPYVDNRPWLSTIRLEVMDMPSFSGNLKVTVLRRSSKDNPEDAKVEYSPVKYSTWYNMPGGSQLNVPSPVTVADGREWIYYSPAFAGEGGRIFRCRFHGTEERGGKTFSRLWLYEGSGFDESSAQLIAYMSSDTNSVTVIAPDCEIDGRFWHNSLNRTVNPSATVKEETLVYDFNPADNGKSYYVADVVAGALVPVTQANVFNCKLDDGSESNRTALLDGLEWIQGVGSVGRGAGCLPYPVLSASLPADGYTRLACVRSIADGTMIWKDPVYGDILGVGSTADDLQARVFAQGRQLTVYGDGAPACVYTADGLKVASFAADGTAVSLPGSGIYIVVCDSLPRPVKIMTD